MTERQAMLEMVYEAMRFALWAAGEGICPAPGEPAKSPEDFLYEYSLRMDVDDWDGLPEYVRSSFTNGVRPSDD